MKVLVTGASGFIGRHVVAELARDQTVEVVAASRQPSLGEQARIRQESVDLLTPGAAANLVARIRPSHLVHLAWNALPGRFWTAPDNLDWAAATFALMRAFVEAGGARAVMAGSCAEYDWTADSCLKEDSPLAPATLYGKVKDATRRIVCGFGDATGVTVAWGRVFWLYGPGEAPGRLVSDVASSLARGRPVETSEGTQLRDFLHVEDVASAFVAALRASRSGPFNIGSGTPVSIRQIIEILAQEFGRQELVKFGARAPALADPPRLVADIGTLRDQFGFKARREIVSGLRSTAEWWRHSVHV